MAGSRAGVQYYGECFVKKSMKIMLLGATGLLGHNVLRRLLQAGHEVVCLVRQTGKVRLADGEWQERVGSLLDDGALGNAAEGCDAIVNCAGTTDMSLRHYADYLPVNRDLCRRLVEVMKSHGISRLVHVSTVNTIGFGDPNDPADERRQMREPFKGSYYADSKRDGEKELLEAAAEHGDWHVVVLNPGFLIGAYDVKPSSGRLLLAAYRKPLMAVPSGGKSFVHVDDVAQAAVSALTRGENGRRYIVTNPSGDLTISELYRMQARVEGYCQRQIVLPRWMMAAAGAMGDALRALGVRTELSTRNVKQLMVRECYDNRLAVRELGLQQTPIETAISDFHGWRKTLRK